MYSSWLQKGSNEVHGDLMVRREKNSRNAASAAWRAVAAVEPRTAPLPSAATRHPTFDHNSKPRSPRRQVFILFFIAEEQRPETADVHRGSRSSRPRWSRAARRCVDRQCLQVDGRSSSNHNRLVIRNRDAGMGLGVVSVGLAWVRDKSLPSQAKAAFSDTMESPTTGQGPSSLPRLQTPPHTPSPSTA